MSFFATILHRIRCLFIINKQERRKIKEAYQERQFKLSASKQKWGVSYSVFDGEELLEASLRHIRPHVNYINVVWQNTSWYGDSADANLLPLLKKLQKERLIDELIEYVPNLSLKAVKNEAKKRNIGLDAARKAGCTYFMPMDTDEFYKDDEMEEAKNFIIQHQITHSYCAQNVYGLNPGHMYTKLGCCCQFFAKLTPFSKHKNEQKTPALVDPTRKISHTPWWWGGSKHYFLHMIRMNHYTYIRKDMHKKLQNSSCNIVRETTIESIKNQDYLNCPDYFHLEEIIKNM